MHPAWEWGRLAQSGRLSAACSGWRTVVTQVRAPSSQSRPPSGRDGTRAHPEQPALPGPALPGAPGPSQLRFPARSELHALPPRRFVRRREEGGSCPPRQQRATCRQDQKCSGHSKKNRTICDGKCVPASFPLSFVVCGGVGGRKPCLFRSVCPLPLISVRPILCMRGVTGSLV